MLVFVENVEEYAPLSKLNGNERKYFKSKIIAIARNLRTRPTHLPSYWVNGLPHT